MTYGEFLLNLDEHYFALWDKGLKKQANAKIAEFMLKFDALEAAQKDELLYELCADIYEKDELKKFFKRGNGALPYELNLRVREFLAREAEANKMPQMRWYFELARDFDVLGRAYAHPQCDERTIELVFEGILNDLYFWQHHFPDGCLASREEALAAFGEGDAMLSRHASGIGEYQKREFEYFKRLYEIFWEWDAGDKSVDFEKFCNERGLSFYEEKVYYYDK